MRRSVIASLSLHAAILIWALVGIPSAREFDTREPPPLPIDILTPAEFTKIKAGTRNAKTEAPAQTDKPEAPEAKKEETKPKPIKAAQLPSEQPKVEPDPAPKPVKNEAPQKAEPTPEAKPEPKPQAKSEPKPEPAPKKAEKPTPQPKVEQTKAVEKEPEKPKKTPPKDQKEPAKKPSDFNPDKIAALLNKVPVSGPKAAPKTTTPAPKLEPVKGTTQGQDASMSMNELDALRARISQCWIPPVGGMGAEKILVKLRMQLNQDGTLIKPPEIMNREGSAFFQVAADSAVRAVMQCQPYELPAAKYASWRDMILNFDPREMFGG